MFTSLKEAEYEMRQAAYSAVSYLTYLVNCNGGIITWDSTLTPALSDYRYRVVGLKVTEGTLFFIDVRGNEVSLVGEDDLGRLYDIIQFLCTHSDYK